MQNTNKIYTTARSRESANAFDDETSKFRPIAAETRSKGSSISLVGVGCRLHKNQKTITRTASTVLSHANVLLVSIMHKYLMPLINGMGCLERR